MATKKIQSTRNYRMFQRSDKNRETNLKKHKKLVESMKKYGFLSSFPIVVSRTKAGDLVIEDGQHRAIVAENLGLPIYWVEEDVEFDIAEINSTAKTWGLRDYAMTYSKNGLSDYSEGLEFADQFKVPVGTAFALLAGTTTYSNIQDQFFSGEFKVKDRAWADSVAGIYAPICEMSSAVRNQRFLEACMAVCRVPEFDAKRLLTNASRCREKLVSYSTRDAYLDMIESVYNFGRVKLFAIKIAATQVMRERNAVNAAVAVRKSKDAKLHGATV